MRNAALRALVAVHGVIMQESENGAMVLLDANGNVLKDADGNDLTISKEFLEKAGFKETVV